MNPTPAAPAPSPAPSSIHPNAEASQLLTAVQLADRWQIKASTVYSLTRSGSIPAVRLGGRLVRYRLAAVEAFEVAGGGETDA